jgi:hypothetical protein
LFNATFDNISVLLILWGFEYARNVCSLSNKLPSIVYWWRKSELPGDNPKPITKHRQGLLYKAESSGPRQRMTIVEIKDPEAIVEGGDVLFTGKYNY